MKRLPKDFIRLVDGSTPTQCAFSMMLASQKQEAFEKWMEQEGIEKEDAYANCVLRKEKLDQRGTVWQEIAFYKHRPVFRITWDLESHMIKVEDL
jgi:hypothetical protein